MSSSERHPQKNNRIGKGRSFEKLAALFFEKNGFEILEQNWQAGHKEIDLIARKANLVAFIEVKSATSNEYGHPAERVDQRKITNLTLAARQYLVEKKLENCDLRFDVVTFLNGELEHFPGAFDAID